MKIRFRLTLFLTVLIATQVAPLRADGIDFAHDIVPILREHCLQCHGDKEAEGGFSINSRESFLESESAVVGDPERSRFLQLIRSDDPDIQMPPPDGARVAEREMAMLAKWVELGMSWQTGFSFAKDTYEPSLGLRHVMLPPAVDGRTNPIDRIIDNLPVGQTRGVSDTVDDATFVRRVSLDLNGLLPDPEMVENFVDDRGQDKHSRLVDRLLENDLAYTEHWLTFWNDLLRNDYAGTGFITGGRKQISRWLYESLAENKPYDVMTRELLAPEDTGSRGFIDGIKWRGDVSAGQTVEIQFSQSVAQSFLGINMKCASCHDSFIDRWKLSDAYGLAAVYAEQPLLLHRCDKPTGDVARAAWLFPEHGNIDPDAARPQRLRQLAALMTHPENGRYTRTIVNRLWCQLMGRGIVHPLDAMHTRPWNEDLLDGLAAHLLANDYDLKAVLRLIATSHAYRCRSEVRDDPSAEPVQYVYRGPRVKRLTAEQFVDAVWKLCHAAPPVFDAPVIRVDGGSRREAVGHDSGDFAADWIWGDSAAEGRLPPDGETIVFRRSIELPSDPIRGVALITADNAFKLYLGGREVAGSDNWKRPKLVPLQGLLKKGMNHITIVASNAGDRPNAAGLFFEGRLVFAGGEERVYRSNENWRFTSNPPSSAKEGRLGKIKGPFRPVVSVGKPAVYQSVLTPKILRQYLSATARDMPMVRASLMKSDFLMRTLGRPNRDQIVTSRPSELTMLEAIELHNGQAFADVLARGADYWRLREFSSSGQLVETLFLEALSRRPTDVEMDLALELLGDEVSSAAVADLLWSITMMPEFLMVR